MTFFSNKAQNLPDVWTTFCVKICHQDLSKIAQSGHTASCRYNQTSALNGFKTQFAVSFHPKVSVDSMGDIYVRVLTVECDLM